MENNFIRINFAESKIPIFKENKAKGFLTYGQDNAYPQMLINLYNSSPKHGAIVTQKAAYIAGDKTEIIGNNTEEIAKANDYLANINAFEDFETLKNKVAQDLELFDGFALEIIWNKAKTAIAEMYHLPFQNLRVSLDGNFMYSEDWADRRAEMTKYFAWNPATRESKQVYYFKMYRAGCGEYPTAPYQSALKYIEIDTEIANFHLNSIKSGFSAQTLIQLFKGIPTSEEMRNTVKRFKDNFSGTDNAGSLIIQFNEPNETPSVINNLAPTDFDKMFMQLNEQVQQEILMSHRVTSPMLFGIKTEGQLGGRSELIEAYEAFQTSYIEPRQQQMDRVFTSLFRYITPVKLVTKNKPPIGVDYVSLFEKGIIDRDEARKELGMTMSVQMSSNKCSCSDQNPFGWDDDKDLEVFAKFGEDASKFTAVPMQFGLGLQAAILQWLYSNKGITLDVLANNINKSVEEIQAEIDMMVEDEIVRVVDGVIEVLPKGIRQLDDSNISTEIVTRYTYQKAPGISGGRIIPTSRDFCKRLVALNRVYTREDIDQISDVIGFDAWRRRGGWMTIKGSSPAAHVPYCRHIWQPQLFRRNL
jgi:hypothetical protein